MTIFYTSSLSIIICVLLGAFFVLLALPKRRTDWWLIAFIGSLILNTAWGFLGPILYGLGKYTFVTAGDIINRLFSLLGYGALLVYAIVLRRMKQAD